MVSNRARRLQEDWPFNMSFEQSDDEIVNFYSTSIEREGAVVKKDSFFYKKRQLDIFLLAMAIGVDSGKREKIKKRSNTIRRDALTEKESWWMCAVALSVEPELSTLADGKKIVNICEEFANGGIRDLIYLDKNPGIETERYEEFFEKKLNY